MSRTECPAADPWRLADAILARIVPPRFPDRDFPLADFGGRDGETDHSAAFSKAIGACHAAGGGRVVVPAGRFRTGPIRLLSNVNLHLEEGAQVAFIPDEERYLPVVRAAYEGNECMNYSPLLYAFEAENIALTGKGVFDGHGEAAIWAEECIRRLHQRHDGRRLAQMGEENVPVESRVFGAECALRPNMLQFLYCRNLLIEGLTFKNSPMWMLHPFACDNLTLRGVTVYNRSVNGDGFDPESCRDVLVRDCVFITRDDCIALKSGRNAEGRRRGRPAENIVVEHCRLDPAPVIEHSRNGFAVGSEIAGGARNVFVRDCTIRGRHVGINIKSNTDRGGVVENIHFRDIEIADPVGRGMDCAIKLMMTYGKRPLDGPHPPTFKGIRFERVHVTQSRTAFLAEGVPASRIRDVRLKDCTFVADGEPVKLADAEPPVLEQVTLNGRPLTEATAFR